MKQHAQARQRSTGTARRLRLNFGRQTLKVQPPPRAAGSSLAATAALRPRSCFWRLAPDQPALQLQNRLRRLPPEQLLWALRCSRRALQTPEAALWDSGRGCAGAGRASRQTLAGFPCRPGTRRRWPRRAAETPSAACAWCASPRRLRVVGRLGTAKAEGWLRRPRQGEQRRESPASALATGRCRLAHGRLRFWCRPRSHGRATRAGCARSGLAHAATGAPPPR